jgi:hypothetical protein
MKYPVFIVLFFLLVPPPAHGLLKLPAGIVASRALPVNEFGDASCGNSTQFRAYLSRLGALERQMVRLRFPVDKTKRVFYPAAAYDSAIARLFKNADVIAVDNHPPLDRSVFQQGAIRVEEGQGGSYLRLGDIDKLRFLGPPLLGGLTDSGYRLHFMTAFTVASDPGRVHLLVQFSEPNGPLRSFLQIHGEVPTSKEQAAASWWMQYLDDEENQPDAVIAKSANHSLSPERNPFMHHQVLGWMQQNLGIVLEGLRTQSAHPDLGAAEFSGGQIPSPVPAGTTQHCALPFPGRFGYGDNVRALYFAGAVP